ncbi:oligosaccharide flippase family protein [Oceanicola sp. S124]|uniref:oligosaccharide flippase family protein n=1 Tax=Oceanicola sp. S124 TaxID=1042378 RepID=UPI00025599C2|nr:polysaccharide biosynthesis C-terminal domain-containing protein [Oceanicola sp. S124]
MKVKTSRILKRLMGIAGMRLLAFALAFVQAVVVARVFGAEVFGIYSFAISVITLIGLVVSFGLDQYIMRELAARGLDVAARDAGFRRILRLALSLVVPLSLATTLLGIAAFWLRGAGGLYSIPLGMVTATFGLLMLRKFLEALALGLKQPVLSFVGSKIVFPLAMIAGAGLVWLTGGARSDLAISLVYGAAMLLSLCAIALVLRRPLAALLRGGDPVPPSPFDRRATLVAGYHLVLVLSGTMIANHMDAIMIATMSTPVEAAYARIAWRLAEGVTTLQLIAMLQYKPLIAEAHGTGDRDALGQHIRTLTWILSLSGIALFIFVELTADWLVLLFGSDFAGAAMTLRAYAVGCLAVMLSGSGVVLLTMTGNERAASRILWISLVLNIVLNLALIPFLGALGAGIATALSQCLLAILTTRACRRSIGFDPSFLTLLRQRRSGTS